MTPDALLRHNRTIRRQRNFFGMLTVALVVSNVFLVGSYTQVQRTTVLVPSRVSDGMVAVGAIDSRFVEALALDATYAFYNVSPQTASYGRKVVERLSSLRDRPQLLDAFDSVADDIRERRITTTFYPERIDHDLDKLKVTITGNLATFIETKLVTRERRVVEIDFVEEAASVRLASMSVVEDAS